MKTVMRVAYNWIRGVFLLAHNPRDPGVETNGHISGPFAVCLARCTDFPFHRSIFILNLPKHNSNASLSKKNDAKTKDAKKVSKVGADLNFLKLFPFSKATVYIDKLTSH